jgi:ABC-type antimicrobial peptide transport system permease subunit
MVNIFVVILSALHYYIISVLPEMNITKVIDKMRISIDYVKHTNFILRIEVLKRWRFWRIVVDHLRRNATWTSR